MPNDSEIILHVPHLSGGRVTAGDHREMAPGQLLELKNFEFTPTGGIKKRMGQKLFSASAGTGIIRGLQRVSAPHQANKTIYAADGSLKRISGTSTISTIKSGFLSDEWDWTTRRGILFGTNPSDGLISYDGALTGGVQKFPDVTKAGCILNHNGLIFLADLEGAPDTVMWSSGEAGNLRFPSTYWAAMTAGKSDRIIKLVEVGWQIFAIGELAVYKLRDTGSLEFVPVMVPESMGCASRSSVTYVGDTGVAYLAKSGGKFRVVLFDGRNTYEISKPISPDMDKIDRGNIEYATGLYARDMYMLSVRESSGSWVTHCFNIPLRAWTKFTGLNFTAAIVEDDTGEIVLGDQNGDIYLWGYLNQDNTTDITCEIRTPFHQAGSQDAKGLRAFRLEGILGGNQNLTYYTYGDYSPEPMTWEATSSKTKSLAPGDPCFYWGQSGIVLDGSSYFGPAEKSYIDLPLAVHGKRAVSLKVTENKLQHVEFHGYSVYGRYTRKG